jgi:YHS domain-containing protein
MRTDPVCNMGVEEALDTPKSVYKGTTYYFSCEGCKEAFDRNRDEDARQQV